MLSPMKDPYKTPLSAWTPIGKYDSARECNEARSKLVDKSADLHSKPSDQTVDLFVRAILLSECVADKDPRLKAN